MNPPALFFRTLLAFTSAFSLAAFAAEADPDMLKALSDGEMEMQERDAAVKMLSKSKEGAMAMIQLAQKGEFPDELKSSAALALAENEDSEIVAAATKALPLPVMKDGKQIVPISKLAEMTGDAKAGRAVFRNGQGPNCINCHQIENEGKEIGPPLNNIGEKAKELLFESILAPSAAVQHGFEAWTVKTKDGNRLSGIKVEDNDEKVTLKTIEGQFIEIPVGDIAKKVKEKKSLMPENLIGTMTTKDLVDLVEFLATQKVNP